MTDEKAILSIFLFSLVFFFLGYLIGRERYKQKANERIIRDLAKIQYYVDMWIETARKWKGGGIGLGPGDIYFDRSYTENLFNKIIDVIGEPHE